MPEHDRFRRYPNREYFQHPDNHHVILQASSGEVIIHPESKIGENVRIIPSPGQTVYISEHAEIGNNTIIYAKNGLIIPSGTVVGEGVMIMDKNFHGIGGNIKEEHQPIIIPHGVKIGNRTIILKGSQITNDIPELSIVTATKVISEFPPEMNELYTRFHRQIELSASSPNGSSIVMKGNPEALMYISDENGTPGFNAYPSTIFYLVNPIKVGYQTFFNADSHIDSTSGPVHIGNNCSISFRTYIGASDQEESPPTIISDQVWVGAGVIVKAGVTIGKGSIISAGAIVTEDVPEFSIVGGRPSTIFHTVKPFKGSHGEKPCRIWSESFR